ncbi:MAG: hypothetical protein DHS20C15_13350 [Planctomycetota bacterium]|nr:MAG: hypothetical protein DHS20C15_13350 [Planctomycetota bacterium]
MLRVTILALTGVLSAPTAAAQLPDLDLQPGRNFGASQALFGKGRSEAVALGDVDNDGDWDVGVANGGDGSAQLNELWINQGGAQGGTQGSFADETAARFVGVPSDTSRDIEFADFDDDGDLDTFIGNRGTTVNNGEVSRAYRNLGGLQHGPVGVFTEDTDEFWGHTVSVPAERQPGSPDDFGPWLGQGRDANFADLDDDGDLDLLLITPGLNMNGQDPSRIFLNNGRGRFDELFPWADDGADIMLHSVDADVADLDGDFDLDIFASSRDSQARVYRNDLAEGMPGGRLFTDITGPTLIDSGGQLMGSDNYEVALGDLDGDGDFDAWMSDYEGPGSGLLNRLLVNRSDGTFVRTPAKLIKSDPSSVDNDADFLDFDGDGDLDTIVANYAGTNFLYVNSLADGVPLSSGLSHRAGASGSLSPGHELPAQNNTGTSLDVDAVDLDGDGDPDLVMVNDLNQQNRYYENTLGVPDTHAPALQAWTDQADKSDGTSTPIHVAVRDNASMYVVDQHHAAMFVSVDGGAESCLRLRAQGGQQFRGVIPAELSGTISYRVEVTDENGNTLVSPTRSYVQSNPSTSLILSLGCGTAGVNGVPLFQVAGTLAPNADTQFTLRDAAPNAFAILFLALQSAPVPFKQGTLHPFPVNAFLPRTTDAGGLDALEIAWPDQSVFPSGLEIWMQYAVQDASVSGPGASLSNAIRLHVP